MPRSAQNTSIASYRQAMASGLIDQRQMQVLEFVIRHEADGPVSQGDCGRHFEDASSSYQPRFKELVDAGLLRECGTKLDETTHRTVKAYRSTGRRPMIRRRREVHVEVVLVTEDNGLFRATFEPGITFREPLRIGFRHSVPTPLTRRQQSLRLRELLGLCRACGHRPFLNRRISLCLTCLGQSLAQLRE